MELTASLIKEELISMIKQKKEQIKKPTQSIKNNNYSKHFIIIAALSIVAILISNITSVKLFSIWNIVLPSSVLLFPLTYIIGDVIAEVYGYEKAKFVIILGFVCNAIMVAFFTIAILLPPASAWGNQEAFATILGTTPRMFIASLTAFLVGSLSNAYIMNFLKKITNGKKLWIRTIGSTIVGELFDTIIFILIGFIGKINWNIIIVMMICQFIWKVGYEIIATPLTYFVINKYKRLEEKNV